MNKKIKLKVNTSALVRSMKDAFTSEDAVITELAQNARRAKATSITIRAGNFRKGEKAVDVYSQKYLFDLEVYDNGNGVMDMQKMISVAESGWDKDTIEEDNPFGMGFLIAIYQSQHITVTSKGRTFSTSQQDILDLRPIDVKLSSDTSPGTTIVMKDVRMGTESFDILKDKVTRLLEGFPIDTAMVDLDTGECYFIARPLSEDALQCFSKYTFPEGTMYISLSEKTYKGNSGYATATINTYFQGLRVRTNYSGSYNFFRTSVFHANKKLGRVRLPDRNEFVNATEVTNRLMQIQHEVEKQIVLEHRDDTNFLLTRFDLVIRVDERTNNSHQLLQLYNDIPQLPQQVETWEFADRHCNLSDNTSEWSQFLDDILTQTTISQGGMKNANYLVLTHDHEKFHEYFHTEYRREGESQALVYLLDQVVQNYVLVDESKLHEDHWLLKNSVAWDDALDALKIDVVNPREHRFPSEHPLEYGHALICDSFNISAKLNGEEYSINVTDDYCVTPPSRSKRYFDVLISVNCTRKFCTSETEVFLDYDTEEYNDIAEELNNDKFEQWLSMELNYDNPAQIIKDNLPKETLKAFIGKNFRVDITKEGLLVYEVPSEKEKK